MRPIRFRRGSSASPRSATGVVGRQRTLLVAAAVLVALSLVAAGSAVALRARSAQRALASAGSASASVTSSVAATPPASTDTTMVEVPDLTGMGLDEAKIVLKTAGFVVKVSEEGSATAKGSKRHVASQDPEAGTVSAIGSTVRLVVPPVMVASVAVAAAVAPKAGSKPAGKVFVVCIDPGHQAHANSTPEPIGPGATATKPSVSGGATGVSTGVPESEVALQISMNLKARLEARGIKVVMTRTTNDVNITNSQRAAVANRAHANLFVRVHCDGSTSGAASGVSTLYPANNHWTRAIFTSSRSAAKFMQAAVVRSTGAVDRGAVQRADLSGFNWATVPSVLVEAGFLSNTVEDKLLSSPRYQDRIATGMTSGILAFLATKGAL